MSKFISLSGSLVLFLLLFTLALIAHTEGSAQEDPIKSIKKTFVTPPASARPWVYWFWVNSNVTPKGITADLEAMKRVGIGGVLIMDINLQVIKDGTPLGPMKFMDNQWQEMFRFAIMEAHRLGLEVNMTNAAGWTGSGGPWITPDDAMQTVVLGETKLEGNRIADLKLPQPPAISDSYHDIAVLAVKDPDSPKTRMTDVRFHLSAISDKGLSDTILPSDEKPLKLDFQNHSKLPSLTFRFDSPYTACVFDLNTAGMDGWFDAEIQASADGKEYHSIKPFTLRNGKNSVVFNQTSAHAFRVQLLKSHLVSNYLTITNLEVHPRFHIEELAMKALFLKRGNMGQKASLQETAPENMNVSPDKVMDVTRFMDKNSHFHWNVPQGKWTVLRFGHTYTGATNKPSGPGGEGPECDKLSKEGIRKNFDGMMKKLVLLAGSVKGKTLTASHIDSWEVGAQNWTKNMPEEFKKRRGYDLIPFLPVLDGRVIGDLQMAERFLWDFRKTISELMVENYFGEMQSLCHKNGLRFSSESYNTIGNDLDAANFTDEPMSEFWTRNGGDWYFDKVKGMSSSAHLNNRPIAGAESFTSAEEEKWLLHPANIKAIGDRFFCDGVNRFVIHRYAMQPWLNRRPGISMGPFGVHYERTQTWWEYSLPWHTYLARCQYLLRQGIFVSDVLNLQPEEPLYRFKIMSLAGYDYDACSPEAFQKVTVSDGKLIDGSGNSHRLLVLTPTETMTLPMLARIHDLVLQGACLLGEPPKATPGLTGYPKADVQLKVITEELWGKGTEQVKERKVGNGRVFRNISPEEALNRIGLVPDFISDRKIRYIHRKINRSEVYFIANGADSTVLANCTFRTAGKKPEWWDPETGKMTTLKVYGSNGPGSVSLPVVLGPSGSGFVIFSPESGIDIQRIVKISHNGKTLVKNGIASGDISNAYIKEGILDILRGEISFPGKYILTKADGKEITANGPYEAELVTFNGPWRLNFPADSGVKNEIVLNQLASWPLLPEKEMNYFSGTATYSKTITIPAGSINKGDLLFLNLGKVAVMARVFVNGKDAGILWKPPYRANIGSLVHQGENSLKIEVVNLWVNRQIGDESLPEDSERQPNGTMKQSAWPEWISGEKPGPTGRQSFTTWRLWKKDDSLQESGLLGPVTVQKVHLIER